MGRFKSALRCKGWVNSVVINVITDVTTYRYFIKYKHNLKTRMHTIRALYQMIHLNVSTK